MRFTRNDKCIRALRLLTSLRNARIGAGLAASGMTLADVEEGWSLLRALGPSRLGPAETSGSDGRSTAVIAQLRAWEVRWFRVADATLARHFSAVREQLFLNLSSVPGAEVAVAVFNFVQRWDDMRAAKSPFGADGPPATDLLARRGLTVGVIDEARAVLESLGKVQQPLEGPTWEADEADLVRAEDALWAWYLEWSQLARITVRDRVLLRQMGFAG